MPDEYRVCGKLLRMVDDKVFNPGDFGNEFSRIKASTTEKQRQAAHEAMLTPGAVYSPLPHQRRPRGEWKGWLLLGGRGAGKTEALTRDISDHVKGPACLPGPVPHWMGIIGPTHGDAVTSVYLGPSGISQHDPEAQLVTTHGGTVVRWPNGSVAKVFGASGPEDAERLRAGGNRCRFFLEELAAWRYLDECFNHMIFGLRAGPSPRWIAATTPKPRPLIKKIVSGGLVGKVVTTHGSTYDNPHLLESTREEWEEAYGGTTLGQQELMGLLIEQDENALWTRERIAELRLSEVDRPIQKIVVGVDPSGGAGEQGIVVVGRNDRIEKGRTRRSGLVLADATCRLDPNGWGARAVNTAIEWDADEIAVEVNYGGDMAVATIQGAADNIGVDIPIRVVTASRGKRPRAEPVAALNARGEWHHVGLFSELEDQLCTWTDDSGYSPDRLDAMVWAAWQNRIVGTKRLSGKGTFSGRAMSTRRLG